MISPADRALLLRIARDAIVSRVTGAPAVTVEGELVDHPGAAFVTIHRGGELRGCIGHLDRNEPLGRVIQRCAVAAATADPRFPPVAADELPALHLELSILGPLEPISGVGDITVGRHGLVVEMGYYRGLLLPQVAIEWGWDAEAFLAHTCQKAGLPIDAWKRGAKLWRFEAEVFGEGRG